MIVYIHEARKLSIHRPFLFSSPFLERTLLYALIKGNSKRFFYGSRLVDGNEVVMPVCPRHR
jgi:hypothetical protein